MPIPIATYRLQFNSDFTFAQARGVIPYLKRLGISTIYASPILKSCKGSPHGYDVVDPGSIDLELGAETQFLQLNQEVRTLGLGWIQDIVPNHMAFDSANSMLMDVLEKGPRSKFFTFFDINWEHPYTNIHGKVLAPFLGKFYGQALESGEIQLAYGREGFGIQYFEKRFPVAIESYPEILEKIRTKLSAKNSATILMADLEELMSLFKEAAMPPPAAGMEEKLGEAKRRLWDLYNGQAILKESLQETVRGMNGQPGEPSSFDQLDAFLTRQRFRLSYWKVAAEELNYRRFFNIGELISIRVEQEETFYATHALILKLVREGRIDGLRVDHIDGLYNPLEYLRRLRKEIGPTYLVVEKIFAYEEELPSVWPVEGTTGYDFLNYLNGVFCEKRNRRAFDAIYNDWRDSRLPYAELVSAKKRLIMGKHMAGDIDNLALLLKTILSRERHAGDFTLYGLRRALVELVAVYPVYRTYLSPDQMTAADQNCIRAMIAAAIDKNPDLLHELRFLEKLFFFQTGDHLDEEGRRLSIHFIMRFQQLTAAVMAKGFEDTVLYVYNRLLSLNEVGGFPDRFGISVPEFHRFILRRKESWPLSMNATSSHDTKRGEDVRCRLHVLSEIPKEWETKIKLWERLNKKKKHTVRQKTVPDKNDAYFFYQNLIGGFPFSPEVSADFVQRLKDYIIKAVREAKVYTAWLKPDTLYEEAYLTFIDDVLNTAGDNAFLKDFLGFQKKIAHFGVINSLSATLVKICSPGVVDFYQGTELWDLSYVDPDNRRPVDFEWRSKLLEELTACATQDLGGLLKNLLGSASDGRIKLFLTERALQVRNAQTNLFLDGDYLPVPVLGQHASHVLGFIRRYGRVWSLCLAPRLLTSLIKEGWPLGRTLWENTQIVLPKAAPSVWENAFTRQVLEGNHLFLGDILRDFPVALLISRL